MSVFWIGGTVIAVVAFIACVAIDYMSNSPKQRDTARRR